MVPKSNSHSDEEDVLTLMYAVADAIDVADEIGSPALQQRLAFARMLLQASYNGLIGVARDLEAAAQGSLTEPVAAPV